MFLKRIKLNIQKSFLARRLSYLPMAYKTQFNTVSDQPNFPQIEEKILDYWNQIDAFKKQLELTKNFKKFTFYDGPPFATGKPHYGHITAGTIKDVVCRYFSQNQHHVERRFGWDCHGLPIEYEIDKNLKIKHRNDVLSMGIAKYNEECRSIVMRYSSEWRSIVGRSGRWIDFDNDYKTMNTSFMESVWWVFKQIWDKGLVYRGCKVMPYSNACNTVLSNFETQQNYQETVDPSIYITFPWISDPDTKFVAWTTTPWTLPSNLALAVNPNFVYVKVYDEEFKTHFVIAECRLQELYSKGKTAYNVVQKFKGSELLNIEYVPLFDYFAERKQDGCFKVIAGDFVTDDAGTGVVHCAPGFGVEDYKVCLKNGLIKPDNPPVPLDENGRYTDKISDFKGVYVKDADKEIRKILRANGRLIADLQIHHNYPMCWRSDTPLIYKAVHCWFIKVTAVKDRLVENNKKAYWVPKFAQEGRFNNWLESAEDWCFSRNRFWGNPIPIWVSDDYEEAVCVGSIEELKQLSGVQEINDLHRENIDHITIPSKQGKGVLRRIDEIFDCWFESGSMPYAQQHYPFKVKEEEFKQIFPADFIAEGMDQTRGWFYTLNVISTILRDDTPYQNLIVNGIVLNDKGEKMSKRKKNYTDPIEIMNQFGADSMRLYLMKSGLVKGESLNFKDEGVKDVIRDIFLPWYNAYRFLIQNIQRFEKDTKSTFTFDESITSTQITNLMDLWIMSSSQSLISYVREQMATYHLDMVAPKLLKFLDELTNWYVRLNRPRIKGEFGYQDWIQSLNVLFDVLLKVSILLSPFVPFITDSFYQNFRKCIKTEQYSADSIHFLQIPQFRQELVRKNIEVDVERMQRCITQARMIREKNKISLKQPVTSLTVITKDEGLIQSLTFLKKYIEEEVNTPSLLFEKDVEKFIELKAEPDNRICGKELGEKFSKDFIAQVRSLSQEQIQKLQNEGKLDLKVKIQREKQIVQEEEKKEDKKKGKKAKKEYEEFETDCQLLVRHVVIKNTYKTDGLPKYQLFSQEEDYSLLLDSRQDEKLKLQGLAREFVNRIQKLRKKGGLNVDDKIIILYEFVKADTLKKAVEVEFKNIQNQVKKPIFSFERGNQFLTIVKNAAEKNIVIEEQTVNITIVHDGFLFEEKLLNEKYGAKASQMLVKSVGSLTVTDVKKLVESEGVLKIKLDGQQYELKPNVDFFYSGEDLWNIQNQ